MIPHHRETDAVVIGILGAFLSACIHVMRPRFGHTALQGAFIEHQVALRQLPLSRKISAIQVRTVDDLEKCSALIIPGGGRWDYYTSIFGLAHAIGRIDNDCFAGQAFRSP